MTRKNWKQEAAREKARADALEGIIEDIWWMARRYAHGRMSYAVASYNMAIKRAQDLGMEFHPDPIDGLIEAKDGMFDKEWFEAREKTQ